MVPVTPLYDDLMMMYSVAGDCKICTEILHKISTRKTSECALLCNYKPRKDDCSAKD